MSVINKMLQDLDRRNASGAEAEPQPRQVKAVSSERRGHEWFWRITAVLVLISVAWVGWVAYQLQSRTIATEQTLKSAAAQPRGGPIVGAQPQPAPAPPVAAPAPPVAAPAPAPAPTQQAKPQAAKPPVPSETFKLARTIETPIRPQAPTRPQPSIRPQGIKPEPKAAQPAAKPVANPEPTMGTVDKRERTKGVNQAGEPSFQRAAVFLRQGRVSEAEEQLQVALKADPSHMGARQAYVALLLEQQRVDAAKRVVGEAVKVNPGHPIFSLALARIHAEQRDYKAALEVIDMAGPVAQNADFQALRGAVLQRLGRHADAVAAYQNAVRDAPQSGGTWTGLGISLEAVGRNADAAQAYQRALGAGPLASEVRDYAEARIRALQ